MDSSETQRGRPRKHMPSDFIRTQCWVLSAIRQFNVSNPTKLEYLLLDGNFKKRDDTDIGGYTSSCIFNKYKNGTKVACPKHIALAETHKKGNGTRKIYDHPFWEVIKFSSGNMQDLYFLLAQLRPKISNLLFESTTDKKKLIRTPIKNIWNTVDILHQESDIDALTAGIGLLIEARYTREDSAIFEWLLSEKLFNFFRRAISFYPLSLVSKEIFQYVKENHLYEHIDKKMHPYFPGVKTWNDYLDSFHIESEIEINKRIRFFLEDSGAVRHHFFAPINCLYLTERYLTKKLKHDLISNFTYEDFISFKKNKDIKKMIRCIRRWEDKLIASRLTSV